MREANEGNSMKKLLLAVSFAVVAGIVAAQAQSYPTRSAP